jgi:subtilisin-like proprotein convertase family protein
VSVNITHTYRGDLKIDLVAPDGSVYNLKASSGSDSAANVIATYTANLSTEALNGTWTLRVQDVAQGDSGTLNNWSITF